MEPALEGQAAVLDVKGEVVDVESAGCHQLDGLVVAHQTIMGHVHIGNILRLTHIHTERLEQEAQLKPKQRDAINMFVADLDN